MASYKDMTPEQKERVKQSNAASDKKNQKIVPLKMKITDLDKLNSLVASSGIARNTWIKQAINEKAMRDTGKKIFDD